MENMAIYNAVRNPPDTAKRTIEAGRLKGMTDINPMWRIKALTEQFGPCGIGWKYVVKSQRLEDGADGTKAAFVDIDLFYKVDGDWADPIPGTGGASFIANERNGKYTSDECFKMALTDAMSVACKALGFGADVYWQADQTKYSKKKIEGQQPPPLPPPPPPQTTIKCERCGKTVLAARKGKTILKTADEILEYSRHTYKMALCINCITAFAEKNAGS